VSIRSVKASGFSIIEVITACAILCVISAITFATLRTSQSVRAHGVVRAEAVLAAESVSELMQARAIVNKPVRDTTIVARFGPREYRVSLGADTSQGMRIVVFDSHGNAAATFTLLQ
jgi:prepilin-type N-terminal cleavage/methylation domain-containing protein